MELVLSTLSTLVGSRVGNIALALVVGMGLGWWKTDQSWRGWEKSQEAIRNYNRQVELAREAQNAVEIAKAATQRVEEDQADLVSLQKQLDDFSKDAANAKDPCLMDDRLINAAQRMRPPAPRNVRPKLTRPPQRPH